jgi:hypothetical protein
MLHSRATRNEIPSIENARHDWLAIRRLAGMLVGRMDQGSAVLRRDVVALHQIVTTISCIARAGHTPFNRLPAPFL